MSDATSSLNPAPQPPTFHQLVELGAWHFIDQLNRKGKATADVISAAVSPWLDGKNPRSVVVHSIRKAQRLVGTQRRQPCRSRRRKQGALCWSHHPTDKPRLATWAENNPKPPVLTGGGPIQMSLFPDKKGS